jgi:hypothetical protein
MTSRARHAMRQSLTLITAVGLLAGCAGSTRPVAPSEPTTISDAHPGMSAASRPEASTPPATGPTAAQAMICGSQIKKAVQQILSLPATPTPTSSFADDKFSCSYALPMGRLRLSVKRSSSDATALTYLTSRATTISAHETLLGLTEHAYGSSTGTVLVLKDNETLEVDATALPAIIGDEQQKRTDLAYEIATNVLGCWTAHSET